MKFVGQKELYGCVIKENHIAFDVFINDKLESTYGEIEYAIGHICRYCEADDNAVFSNILKYFKFEPDEHSDFNEFKFGRGAI